MEHIINSEAGLKSLSPDELMTAAGRDHIRDVCALIGVIAVATGGAVAANPIGMAAVGFCAGYTFGVVIGSWL